MKHRLGGVFLSGCLIFSVMALGLAGCGSSGTDLKDTTSKEDKKETAATGNTGDPTEEGENEDDILPIDTEYIFEDDGALHITSVKGLIEALAEGGSLEIDLAPGTYDISSYIERTSKYDSGDGYVFTYNLADEGKELILSGFDDLCIRGAKDKKTEIVTKFRYVDVISFSECSGVRLENLVFGHAPEEGYCEGAVLDFVACNNITLNNVEMYGCGTYGISARYTSDLSVWDSQIHNCSYGILDLSNCSNISFDNTVFRKCREYTLLDIYYSSVSFQGCLFEDNKGDHFLSSGGMNSLIFENCSFDKWESKCLVSEVPVEEGVILGNNCSFDGNNKPETVTFVSNVKELVEAIEPGARIRLKRGNYNLTEYLENVVEEEQGRIDSPYVYLEEVYDGWELRISGVQGLAIIGGAANAYATKLLVEPRYATVLTFEECEGIYLSDLTMGHTDGDGYCSGNVLNLDECRGVLLHDLDLYGCGYIGLEASETENLQVMDTVIHDCNGSAMWISDAEGAYTFLNSTFTDCEDPMYLDGGQADFYFNGCFFGVAESEIEYDDHITQENCTYDYGEDDWYWEDEEDWYDDFYGTDIYSLNLEKQSFDEYDFDQYLDFWYGYEYIPEEEPDDQIWFNPSFRINLFEDGTGVLIDTDTGEELAFVWEKNNEGDLTATFDDDSEAVISYYGDVYEEEGIPQIYGYYLKMELSDGELWFY